MDVTSAVLSSLPPLTLTLTAILLAIIYTLFNLLRHPSEYPPMPVQRNPLIGHSLGANPLRTLAKWREKTGDIYSIYFGSSLHIVLNSYDLMRVAFVKNGDKFSHRGRAGINKARDDYDKGLLASEGANWKAQRTVSLSILRDLGMGKNIYGTRISAEVESYMRELSDLKGQPTNVRALTHVATINVISAIVVGHRFEYNDPMLLDIVEMIGELVTLGRRLTTLIACPWLKYLKIPGDPFGAERLRYLDHKIITEFSCGHINKCRQNMDNGNRNFITSYVTKMATEKDSRNGRFLDEKNLRKLIENLFIAGSETTGSTLLWAYAFAVNYPTIQEKVHREIVSVVGRDRRPCLQDRPHLNYLNAFILETQRLGSIVPLSLTHQCNETTQLAGFTIPKGAFIIPNLDAVLKDDAIWNDGRKFRPKRFLDKDGNLRIPEQFVPFSLGRRACLGESLAKMELFLFLSSIFQRFEICPEGPDNFPELKPVLGTTSAPIDSKVVFKEYAHEE